MSESYEKARDYTGAIRFYTFAGKPLIDLNNIPMVVRTFQRCALAFDRNCIFVATESHQIKETCEQYGINVL